jgi:hypothetical protein
MICRDGIVSRPYKASPATPTKYSCSSVLKTMPGAVFPHGLSFFFTVLQISFTTNITGYSDQVARLLWLPHMRTSKNKITVLICLFFKKNHSHSCGQGYCPLLICARTSIPPCVPMIKSNPGISSDLCLCLLDLSINTSTCILINQTIEDTACPSTEYLRWIYQFRDLLAQSQRCS